MSVILNMWGEDYALQFVKQNYFNGNLAIEVISEDEEYGGWEPWCSLTVNLPGFMLDENEAFIDTNNCSKEIVDWIFKNKYARKIGQRQSGFCTYPLVEFSKGIYGNDCSNRRRFGRRQGGIIMKTIIDKSECAPLSEHIKGKLVVVSERFFKPDYKEAKYQLVLATGGFGCDAEKLGSAVFVIDCCENPEHYRVERFDLIGEPTEELIAEWKAMYGEFNQEVLEQLQKGE